MNDEQILQASRYADGEMDAPEQQDFEALMQQDDELRNYVTQYREAQNALRMHLVPDPQRDQLKQTLAGLNNTYFKEQEKPEAKVVSFRSYARWISGVAAVLIIGLLIFNPWRGDLYHQYSTATTMSVSERGAGPETDLERAAALYNDKKYSQAEPLLATISKADTTNSLVQFYYAVTLIEDKKEADARPVLEKLYNGQSAFKYNAAYYMALSYIKVKDKANCRKWLERVPQGTSNYAKAQELLKKL